jgi:hypothetical protein
MRYSLAVWDPGVNANYNAGTSTMQAVVCHYTVGRDSRPIGRRGYFNFLVARDGMVYQFAPADAINWHAGLPWNLYGPGIEIEYLPGYDDEIFTLEAYHSTALLVEWLSTTYNIPLDFYDGERIKQFNGFITHRSLIQTGDAHSDWWPELPITHNPKPPPKEDEMKGIFVSDSTPGGDGKVWFLNNGVRTYARSPRYIDLVAYFQQAQDNSIHELSQSDIDTFPIWEPV